MPYKLLDAALSILYIPLGVSVTHMLIHEEHYDHMKADGLFRFYRDPKTMLRCILLVALTTGAVKALLFVVEERVEAAEDLALPEPVVPVPAAEIAFLI